MVHLVKLAVGVRDLGHLRELQTRRLEGLGELWHQTRRAPKRTAELVRGGSIYWVVDRVLCVRQGVMAVRPGVRPDGSACAELVLDPALVEVAGRATRPFQGWRYLEAADAPADVPPLSDAAKDLPEELVRQLRALALL